MGLNLAVMMGRSQPRHPDVIAADLLTEYVAILPWNMPDDMDVLRRLSQCKTEMVARLGPRDGWARIKSIAREAGHPPGHY